MLQVLFVLKILKFLSRPFSNVGKRLDKKAKVNFKIYDTTDWETNNSIHIIHNFLRGKDNQTMRLG